jgi:hypothetical protein
MQVCHVQPIHSQNVGKVIKTSKKRIFWHFKVHNDIQHTTNSCRQITVLLFESQVSKKRKIEVNGKPVTDLKTFPMTLLTEPVQVQLRQERSGAIELFINETRYYDLVQMSYQNLAESGDQVFSGKCVNLNI